MKIGILTFHSQTNYGGVLQAYAMQETIREMGYDVCIIDRWMDECNSALKGITVCKALVPWFKFLVRMMLGFGDGVDYVRHIRTAKKLPSLLNLSPFSFFRWENAPADLGVDLLIVGSDQVWNPMLQGESLPYLLKNAPKISAISYAASFGVSSLPKEMVLPYKKGLMRFDSISVREKEAVDIVQALGCAATHVVDPTLLVGKYAWDRICELPYVHKKHKKLVCYFIEDPLGFVVRDLARFARVNGCDIELFFGGPCQILPGNLWDLVRISTGFLRAYLSSRVHVRMSATPDEFVREIADADWVLTDSFHAVMFSTIFQRNLRVLAPKGKMSKIGFSRLEEFVSANIKTKTICESLSDALKSLIQDPMSNYDVLSIEQKRENSKKWLKTAIERSIR